MKAKISKKKFAIITSLVTLMLLSTASAIVAFAVYTKSSRAKRVISAYGDEGMMFSSNYLNLMPEEANQFNYRALFASSEENGCEANVTVCNYSQKNKGSHYEKDIDYTLFGRLMYNDNGTYKALFTTDGSLYTRSGEVYTAVSSGSFNDQTTYYEKVGTAYREINVIANDLTSGNDMTISKDDVAIATLNNTTVSFETSEQTLSNMSSVYDVYTIDIDSYFNDRNYLLFLRAVPGEDNSELTPIEAVFATKVAVSTSVINWTGEVTEYTNQDGKMPYEFDGFNYLISGYGNGDVTLSWLSDKLTINQLFLFDTLSGVTVSTPTTFTTNGSLYTISSQTEEEYNDSIDYYKLDNGVYVVDNTITTEELFDENKANLYTFSSVTSGTYSSDTAYYVNSAGTYKNVYVVAKAFTTDGSLYTKDGDDYIQVTSGTFDFSETYYDSNQQVVRVSGDANERSISFSVNSSITNIYEIQMYRVSKDVNFSTWSELLNCIKFEFTPN